MTNIEYVNGALRTEAPVTPEMVDRLMAPGVAFSLQSAMLVAAEMGAHLDLFKKHLFYGKALPTILTNNEMSPDITERLSSVVRLLHAVSGFVTESAEMMEALYKHIYGGEPLDITNLIEESGDMFWYMALYADTLSVTFDYIMMRNNAKLRARYPEKFTSVQALTRDLSEERRVLETSDGRVLEESEVICGSQASFQFLEGEELK